MLLKTMYEDDFMQIFRAWLMQTLWDSAGPRLSRRHRTAPLPGTNAKEVLIQVAIGVQSPLWGPIFKRANGAVS